MNWLHDQILQSAQDLESAGGTLRCFRRIVQDRLAENPISLWELIFWTRGVKRGLIQVNSPWFRLGSGRQTTFGFFVRNEAGLTVGLRRESITQAAVYVMLVTHYGYHRRAVRFETDYLDVALEDAEGRVNLYAETKASGRTLERLLERLSENFQEGLPSLNLRENERPPDDHQKAAHILRRRPRFFWGVSPTRRQAYTVRYTGPGFRLAPIDDIPFCELDDLFAGSRR